MIGLIQNKTIYEYDIRSFNIGIYAWREDRIDGSR